MREREFDAIMHHSLNRNLLSQSGANVSDRICQHTVLFTGENSVGTDFWWYRCRVRNRYNTSFSSSRFFPALEIRARRRTPGNRRWRETFARRTKIPGVSGRELDGYSNSSVAVPVNCITAAPPYMCSNARLSDDSLVSIRRAGPPRARLISRIIKVSA